MSPRVPGRHRVGRPLALVTALLALLGGLAAAGLTAAAAPTYPPLSGGVTGPTLVAEGGKGTYVVTAAGGPAEAVNGTQVGIYSYHASIVAGNTSGASVNPPSGVLVNGSVKVGFIAPNVTESVTITVEVTSGFGGTNVSQNFTESVQVVQPYKLQATIALVGSASVAGFDLTVDLDGQPVGTISVPSLSAGATYPISFSYVTTGLSVGYHTFSINLAQEHGLVTFTSGSEQLSSTFYVPGAPPDNTTWYVLGVGAFFAAVFILLLRVGPRRPGRTKK